MHQVSSNLTLVLKIFIPTFWLVVFGLFGFVVWFTTYDVFGSIPATTFRIGYAVFYLLFILFFYFTIMNLKRVEMSDEGLFATNFFKHYRYSWESIEKITEAPFPFVRVVTITFKEKTSFGKKIHFIPSKKRFQDFLISHPKISEQLLEKEVTGV